MNRRTPSSPATEPMSAPTAEPDEWAAKIMELAHRWAQATYCKGQGRPFEDFDAIQIEMCSLLTTPPSAATPEPSDAEREALRYAEMSMAAMRDALMPSFEYVGVSLRVSQEDHAAIRSALASMSTALHMVRAAIRATKGGKL